jgi:hypothetical protein
MSHPPALPRCGALAALAADLRLLIAIFGIRDKGCYPEYASRSLLKFGLFDGQQI